MAADSPRRSTGPGEQSICGERMRSPAPSQRLQVTGGILKFTIYQDVRLETRGDRKWLVFFFYLEMDSIYHQHPGPVFIKLLKVPS